MAMVSLEALAVYGILAVAFLLPVTAVAVGVSFVTQDRRKWMAATMLVTGAAVLWYAGWFLNAFSSDDGGIVLTWFDRILIASPFALIAIADSALVVYAIARETDK